VQGRRLDREGFTFLFKIREAGKMKMKNNFQQNPVYSGKVFKSSVLFLDGARRV
jgi:hypothetical protein